VSPRASILPYALEVEYAKIVLMVQCYRFIDLDLACRLLRGVCPAGRAHFARPPHKRRPVWGDPGSRGHFVAGVPCCAPLFAGVGGLEVAVGGVGLGLVAASG
jgi:hypothetical protein